MTTEIQVKDKASRIETVLMTGDLTAFSPEERVVYHDKVCKSLGLNPLTRPFDYIKLNGKLLLYAKKDATEQLRAVRKVSLVIGDRITQGDVYIVTAKATLPDGRTDESTGAVTIGELRGDNLANAYMKAETKAKRRVTLSICGLGLLDEMEAHDVPNEMRDIKQPNLNPKPDPKKPTLPPPELNKEDMQQLKSLIEESGFTGDDIKDLCDKRWGVTSAAKLTKAQFTELCAILAGGEVPDELDKVEVEDMPASKTQPAPIDNHVSQ